MVPMELPGAKVPPLIKTSPMVPVPPSVPPLFTVVMELLIEPLTDRVPELTVVAPVYVLMPIKLKRPVPCLVKLPVPLIAPA